MKRHLFYETDMLFFELTIYVLPFSIGTSIQPRGAEEN